MASLQGLPPLPRSLRGLLNAGSAQWKETEKIHQLRTSIEHDIEGSESEGDDSPGDTSPTDSLTVPNGGSSRKNSVAGCGSRKNSVHKPPVAGNLESTIAFLRREMVSLRQLDMSLLCQLWGLNEAIQELKHASHDRVYDTISECSSFSLENGLDTISTIEEHEYENEMFHSHKYENVEYANGARPSPAKPTESKPVDEDIYEPVYLEPTPCKSSRKHPLQKAYNNNYSNCPSPAWTRQCACNTTYESSC